MHDAKNVETEIQISLEGSETPITLAGNLGRLHDNPQKIHELLDLLELPKGTEAKVITKAASVIVR